MLVQSILQSQSDQEESSYFKYSSSSKTTTKKDHQQKQKEEKNEMSKKRIENICNVLNSDMISYWKFFLVLFLKNAQFLFI